MVSTRDKPSPEFILRLKTAAARLSPRVWPGTRLRLGWQEVSHLPIWMGWHLLERVFVEAAEIGPTSLPRIYP